MKRLVLILLWVAAGVCSLHAQGGGRPAWVTRLPEASNDTYYYRVTMAEGRTREKAYAKAFAMAILESSWKLGVVVDTKDDVQALEQGIVESISVQEAQMVLPLNKVCEYEERLGSSMNIRLYVLWQVAADAKMQPRFDPFIKCN